MHFRRFLKKPVNFRDSLDDSLVLWLRFEESAGSTAFDSSRKFNHGTIDGATYVAGRVGENALSFDGDDVVSLGTPSSLDMRTKATISFWINFDTLDPVDAFPSIFDNVRGGGVRKGIFIFYTDSTDRFSFRLYNNGVIVLTATLLKDDWVVGTWYHVVAVWDSTLGEKNLQWYVDNVAAESTDDTSVPDGISNDIQIGLTFEGSIDEMRVYNRALSATEVSQLYTSVGGT